MDIIFMMKVFFYSLTIAMLFFNYEVFSEESKNIDSLLNEKQKFLTELIKSIYDPVEIKWINTYTIDVTCDQDLMDVMSEPDTKIAAELLAKLGYEITHENICIKITDHNGKERAYQCVKNNEEFAEEHVITSEIQEQIAKRIKSVSGVSQARWINTSLLEISIDFSLDPKSNGEKAAAILAPWVHEVTGKPICVKITNSIKEELAHKCVGKDQHI